MKDSSHQDSGVEHYLSVADQISIESASPYRLIQLLMEGALEKINFARGYMLSGETTMKSSHVSWAISIIDGLRMSLDKDAGGDIAENLDALYNYMTYRLVEANLENNVELIDEVGGLLIEIKSAWDDVGDLLRQDISSGDDLIKVSQ